VLDEIDIVYNNEFIHFLLKVVQNLSQISKKYASKKLYSKDSRDLLKKEAKTKKVRGEED
jgi:hypothetical protein